MRTTIIAASLFLASSHPSLGDACADKFISVLTNFGNKTPVSQATSSAK